MRKRKALVLAGLAWLVVGVGGCGSASDQVIKEQIQAMNDLADALESKAPAAKIADLQNRLRDVQDKWKALSLSESARKDLLEKYQKELMQAGMRLTQASMGRATEAFRSLDGKFPQLPAGAKVPR